MFGTASQGLFQLYSCKLLFIVLLNDPTEVEACEVSIDYTLPAFWISTAYSSTIESMHYWKGADMIYFGHFPFCFLGVHL